MLGLAIQARHESDATCIVFKAWIVQALGGGEVWYAHAESSQVDTAFLYR
jgi:hypothetical protein